METVQLLDTVATLKPVALERLTLVELNYTSTQNLPIGQVGTIVEIYEEAKEPHYLIEFADRQGHEYAMATLKADEFLVLHYEITIA